MSATYHLEPSSELFIVLRNKNVSDFGYLPTYINEIINCSYRSSLKYGFPFAFGPAFLIPKKAKANNVHKYGIIASN